MAEGWLVLGSEIKKNHAVLLEEANFNTQLQNNMCESKCVLLMISKVCLFNDYGRAETLR